MVGVRDVADGSAGGVSRVLAAGLAMLAAACLVAPVWTLPASAEAAEPAGVAAGAPGVAPGVAPGGESARGAAAEVDVVTAADLELARDIEAARRFRADSTDRLTTVVPGPGAAALLALAAACVYRGRRRPAADAPAVG